MYLETIKEAIQNKVCSGAALAVKSSEKWEYFSVGSTDYSHGYPIKTDTVFDCASVTKSIPTGLLALQLLDRELLTLETSVQEVIPELAMKGAEQIQLKHLLTHTLDFSFSLAQLKTLSAKEIWEKITQWEFPKPPGAKYLYCNTTSVLLGIFLERFTQKRLDVLAHEKIFNPLGMEKTGFNPLAFAEPSEIMPTEKDPWRQRVVWGEVHDESASVLKALGCPGSAGLFSTVKDLSKVIEEILKCARGVSEQGLFSKRILEKAFLNQTVDLGTEVALGFEKNQAKFMGERRPQTAIGKTGFTGASVLFDVPSDKALIFLSNFTWPQRENNADRINELRSKLADILWHK